MRMAENDLSGRSKLADGSGDPERQAVIVVLEGTDCPAALDVVCQYLGVAIEHVSTFADLATVLDQCRPMAVIAESNAASQDGFRLIKTVGGHDPSLPLLLLGSNESPAAGAVDAVEDVWNLAAVTKSPPISREEDLVRFLFHAGLSGRCLGLVPI